MFERTAENILNLSNSSTKPKKILSKYAKQQQQQNQLLEIKNKISIDEKSDKDEFNFRFLKNDSLSISQQLEEDDRTLQSVKFEKIEFGFKEIKHEVQYKCNQQVSPQQKQQKLRRPWSNNTKSQFDSLDLKIKLNQKMYQKKCAPSFERDQLMGKLKEITHLTDENTIKVESLKLLSNENDQLKIKIEEQSKQLQLLWQEEIEKSIQRDMIQKQAQTIERQQEQLIQLDQDNKQKDFIIADILVLKEQESQEALQKVIQLKNSLNAFLLHNTVVQEILEQKSKELMLLIEKSNKDQQTIQNLNEEIQWYLKELKEMERQNSAIRQLETQIIKENCYNQSLQYQLYNASAQVINLNQELLNLKNEFQQQLEEMKKLKIEQNEVLQEQKCILDFLIQNKNQILEQNQMKYWIFKNKLNPYKRNTKN